MTFRPFDEPELIEVRDWSVWLRFPEKISQSKVHDLLRSGLFVLTVGKGDWEIRPIRRIEEREER